MSCPKILTKTNGVIFTCQNVLFQCFWPGRATRVEFLPVENLKANLMAVQGRGLLRLQVPERIH